MVSFPHLGGLLPFDKKLLTVTRAPLFAMLLPLTTVVFFGCDDLQSTSIPTSVSQKSPRVDVTDDDAVLREVDAVLDFTYLRPLDANVNAAWQIVHGIMAFGPDYQILIDGKPRRGLEWILDGGNLTGWNLRPTKHGVRAILEAGSKTGQGHPDQWMGYLSHCGLSSDQPIVINGQTYTLADIVRQACWDVYQGQECSWTLMGLSEYMPLDAQWQNSKGETWDLNRIIGLEASSDINSSACGGSHRLYGMTMALNKYKETAGAKPLEGGWKLADQKIRDAILAARQFQHPNGAFSTSYFLRPATSADIGTKLATTGHTLEFLCLAMDKQQLGEAWVTNAAMYLCRLLRQTRDEPLECGALYHAAHALHLYRQRRFGVRSFAHLVLGEGSSGVATSGDGAEDEKGTNRAEKGDTVKNGAVKRETEKDNTPVGDAGT